MKNAKKNKIFVAFVFAVCITQTVKSDIAYINSANGVCVREKPDVNSKVLSILDYGQKVAILHNKTPGGWSAVEGGGYVCSEFIQESDPFEDMELLGTWRVTAYAETGYCCANGNYPTVGYTIACNSLPFGTEVFIEDVGFRTVEDRGPAYLGDAWLDLYLGEYDACVQWGDQTKKVWKVER